MPMDLDPLANVGGSAPAKNPRQINLVVITLALLRNSAGN